MKSQFFLTALTVVTLSACTTLQTGGPGNSTPVTQAARSQSEITLIAGIKEYEDGNYTAAGKHISEALSLGLGQRADQVQAHKYLAFMACTSGNKNECSAQFRAALTLDPSFELTKAERGHPQWGPVFVAVRHIMSKE